MSNQVYISQDANEVNLVNTDKQIVITEVGDGTTVNVTQPITSVITVASVGPQGQPGPTGPQGPSGSLSINSSGSFGITGSLFISGSNPLTVMGPVVFTGSLNVTQGITGSLLGTSSYALTASYATNISGGSTGYVPLWKSNSTLGTSSIHQDDGNVGIGILLPEAKLHVKGQGSTDLYTSFIVQNSNGNPSFVILGSGHVGIENLAPSYELDVTGTGRFTNGLLVTGSLRAPSITGSVQGTASNAVSSSYALTASYLEGQSPTSSYALTASYLNPLNQDVSLTGNIVIRGTASVDVLVTNYESSSIIYSSGSTKFGDTLDDTHQFTGSVYITGSAVELQGGSFSGSGANLFNIPASGITGLNLSQIATGSVTASVSSGTGSFTVSSGSSNFFFVSSSGNVGIGTTTPSRLLHVNEGGTRLYQTFKPGVPTLYVYHGRTENDSTVRFENGSGDNLYFGGNGLFVTGNTNIGSGTTLLGARLGVRGSGATSSTTSLLVQNSNGLGNFQILDDSSVQVINEGKFSVNRYGNTLLTTGQAVSTLATYNSYITIDNNFITLYRSLTNVWNLRSTYTETYAPLITFTTFKAIDSSAQLEVSSTTKGFLPPRNNTTSNISAPAQGLQTYITASATEGLYYYNSGSYQGWTRVLNDSGSQAISGSLTTNNGNLIVNSGSIFVNTSNTIKALGYTLAPFYVGVTNGKNIGFTYNGAATIISLDDGNTAVQPLQFRASSFNFTDTSGLRISNTGYGSTPSAMLHVVGSGTTSSTTSLLVQNSSGTNLLQLTDDNQINLGNTSAYSSARIKFLFPNSGTSGNGIFWGDSTTTSYSTDFGSITLSRGGGQLDYYTGTSYFHRFLTLGGTEVMRIGTGYTANIGIRTTTPQAGLHIGINTIISGSAGTNTLSIGTLSSGSALTVYKSGSTVVDIQGSQGQLFSVIDALSGSLMSVNDISGLPILEVFSDDRVVMGTYGNAGLIVTGSDVQISASLFGTRQTGSLATGSTLLYTVNTGSYTAGFFDYFINSGSNYRAGNIMAVFGAGTYKFTDLATPDIGSTTNLQFSMSMAGASAQLYASASSAGWTVKTTFRTI